MRQLSTAPAFLNVLTDCPLGWGHEPRQAPHVIAAAVETRFWPLYEVADGSYSLTYEPPAVQPVTRWLEGQKRFAHLLRPENAQLVIEIQASVDRDGRRSAHGAQPASRSKPSTRRELRHGR